MALKSIVRYSLSMPVRRKILFILSITGEMYMIMPHNIIHAAAAFMYSEYSLLSLLKRLHIIDDIMQRAAIFIISILRNQKQFLLYQKALRSDLLSS